MQKAADRAVILRLLEGGRRRPFRSDTYHSIIRAELAEGVRGHCIDTTRQLVLRSKEGHPVRGR